MPTVNRLLGSCGEVAWPVDTWQLWQSRITFILSMARRELPCGSWHVRQSSVRGVVVDDLVIAGSRGPKLLDEDGQEISEGEDLDLRDAA